MDDLWETVALQPDAAVDAVMNLAGRNEQQTLFTHDVADLMAYLPFAILVGDHLYRQVAAGVPDVELQRGVTMSAQVDRQRVSRSPYTDQTCHQALHRPCRLSGREPPGKQQKSKQLSHSACSRAFCSPTRRALSAASSNTKLAGARS